MTEQEYLDSISSRSDDDYPAVVKISDPLLIRLSPDSLMISDTTFYAKVKYGLAFSGYVIYSSGLGTPIIEVDLTKEYSKSSSSGDNVQRNKDDVLKELVKRAAEFLDKLEARVATSESANVIKESIDRLCWQLHYDITKSKTNFVTAFEDQGFSKSVTSVDGWSSSSTVVGRTLYDYFGWTGTVTNNGSVLEYGNGLIGMTEKVAWNLKHDNETYSISKALREDNEVSVSNATHEQTVLEQQHYTNISVHQLGSFGDTRVGEEYNGNYRTLFDSINSVDSTTPSNSVGYSIKQQKRLDEVLGHDSNVYPTYEKSVTDKLGKFGDSIPGGSDHYRTLFETFNKETVAGSTTVYRGPSHIWDKTLCDTIGGTSNSTDSDEKKSIYTRMKKVVSDADAENDNVAYTVLGNIGSTVDTGTDTLFGLSNRIKTKTDSLSYAVLGGTDYSQAPTDNIYTALLHPENGAIQKCIGYLYADNKVDATFIQDGGNPKQYQSHYYIATESSRFALMYNLAYPQTKGVNTIKSQEATNPVPW